MSGDSSWRFPAADTSVETNMVQLSRSPSPDVSPPPERSVEEEEETLEHPKVGSPGGSLHLSLDVSTTYHGYETYIEDGLICLKHKIRNLEKKKLKLRDYKKRLNRGEVLNKDQMVAVEKFDEVLHNLEFARELHKTLDGLTQNLLKAHRKVLRKQQVLKVEAERRRLSTVLQVQQVLTCLQQDNIRTDLLSGRNTAPHVPVHRLQVLDQLAAMLGLSRDPRFSLEKQMEEAAQVYLDLLDGKDEPVAGSTFKLLKEELTMLLNCQFFSRPPSRTDGSMKPTVLKSKPNQVSKQFLTRLYLSDLEAPPTHSWTEDFQTLRDREPPDCWDSDIPERPPVQPASHKPWRGAAAFIPKASSKKQSADCKQRKERKAKGEQNASLEVHMEMPVEIFNSPSAFPKDPVLRKQHLEDLLTKIHGSFTFMQDSLLDGESSPANGHPRLKRRPSGSASPLAQTDLRSPSDVLPKTMHSTPLPARRMENKSGLDVDQELPSKDLPDESLELSDRKPFPSPPLYRRPSTVSLQDNNSPRTPVNDSGKRSPSDGSASCTSTPPQSFSTPPTRKTLTSTPFPNIQTVLEATASLAHNGEANYKADPAGFSEPLYSTASTQTPPEFCPAEDELQAVYTLGNGGQSFLSPGQSGGSRPSQSYTRGSVRGVARGGRGVAQSFRSAGWHRAGSCPPHAHLRDSALLPYSARDSGYQHSYRRGGGRHNSSGTWSVQVSSPDPDGTCTLVDSGQGDSLSVSSMEVPLPPHHHHHPPPSLLPMQLYSPPHPLRVAFTASRTANFAPGNLDQPIVFDQLHSNLGEMYDVHVGRFTCPANGTYVFLFHILKLAVNVPLYINLMRNQEVMVSAYANDGAPDHETASNHALLPLFQGDQVWLRLHRGAIYGSTWKYSTFSGFLLYQD